MCPFTIGHIIDYNSIQSIGQFIRFRIYFLNQVMIPVIQPVIEQVGNSVNQEFYKYFNLSIRPDK